MSHPETDARNCLIVMVVLAAIVAVALAMVVEIPGVEVWCVDNG